jgi:hypothetical protein
MSVSGSARPWRSRVNAKRAQRPAEQGGIYDRCRSIAVWVSTARIDVRSQLALTRRRLCCWQWAVGDDKVIHRPAADQVLLDDAFEHLRRA